MLRGGIRELKLAVETKRLRWEVQLVSRPRAPRDLNGPVSAYPKWRSSPLCRSLATTTVPSHLMPRSRRPKQENTTPVGKTATLHSFFGSATQSTPIRVPSKPEEIIVIDSGDENAETSPKLMQPKRKALGDPDAGGSSGLKKGKLSRGTAQPGPEDDSPLRSMPLSSLNFSVETVEGDLYTQNTQTQPVITIVGDWETGDDEFLGLVDDSQAVGDEEDSPENTLDTCPVCGAIFVDFCLSVSVTPPPLMGPFSSHPYSATSSTHQRLHR